jgi:hypothetical protein
MPFPYGDDQYFAPRTDGILLDTGDIPNNVITMPPPNGAMRNAAVVVTEIGTMQDYVEGTSCVNCNQINYNQMAGSD